MNLQSLDCLETASTVSGSDQSEVDSVSSWDSSLSEADPEVLDPVLSVPTPSHLRLHHQQRWLKLIELIYQQLVKTFSLSPLRLHLRMRS